MCGDGIRQAPHHNPHRLVGARVGCRTHHTIHLHHDHDQWEWNITCSTACRWTKCPHTHFARASVVARHPHTLIPGIGWAVPTSHCPLTDTLHTNPDLLATIITNHGAGAWLLDPGPDGRVTVVGRPGVCHL